MKKIVISILLVLTISAFSKHVHYMTISKLIFSKNGKLLYSSSFDSTGIIWNVKTKKAVSRISGQRGFMTSMALSAKYKRILTSARDKTIAMRTLSGRLLKRIRGHSDAVNYVLIINNTAVSASDNGEVFVYRFPAMYKIAVFRFRVPGIDTLSISPDSKILIAGCVDGNIRIINLDAKRFVAKKNAHNSYIYASLFLSNKYFITAGNNGTIIKWNRKGFNKINKVRLGAGILSMINVNGKIYAGTKTGHIFILRSDTLKILSKIKISNNGISALAYNISKNLIAAGDEKGAIYLFNKKDMKKINVLGR